MGSEMCIRDREGGLNNVNGDEVTLTQLLSILVMQRDLLFGMICRERCIQRFLDYLVHGQ